MTNDTISQGDISDIIKRTESTLTTQALTQTIISEQVRALGELLEKKLRSGNLRTWWTPREGYSGRDQTPGAETFMYQGPARVSEESIETTHFGVVKDSAMNKGTLEYFALSVKEKPSGDCWKWCEKQNKNTRDTLQQLHESLNSFATSYLSFEGRRFSMLRFAPQGFSEEEWENALLKRIQHHKKKLYFWALSLVAGIVFPPLQILYPGALAFGGYHIKGLVDSKLMYNAVGWEANTGDLEIQRYQGFSALKFLAERM